jgi:hypothetical protein
VSFVGGMKWDFCGLFGDHSEVNLSVDLIGSRVGQFEF